MPFQLSIPKSAATAARPHHRKVTVEAVEEGGAMTLNMTELLLAIGAEPADVLPAVGFDEFQSLMKLREAWDIIESMHADMPNIFKDREAPMLKLCHSLLVRKLHPDELLRRANLDTITNLLEMQLNWGDIKENYKIPEPVCDFCGSSVNVVLRCSGCMAVRKEVKYCNKECQKAGWKQHKKDGCGLFASEKMRKKVAKACGK